MATVAAKNLKPTSDNRWETLWIPPLRQRDEFRDRALECMGEKKIDMNQMVIFTCFIDYGSVTNKLADPSTGEYDWDRGLVASMDELCEITCKSLGQPREKVVEAGNLFVELGLLQGLTRERAP